MRHPAPRPPQPRSGSAIATAETSYVRQTLSAATISLPSLFIPSGSVGPNPSSIWLEYAAALAPRNTMRCVSFLYGAAGER